MDQLSAREPWIEPQIEVLDIAETAINPGMGNDGSHDAGDSAS